MARGWESKSVESQIESARTSDAGAGSNQAAGTDGNSDKTIERERQSLLLSRAYLLHRIESSSHERYTESLRRALSEIDEKLSRLK